MIERHIKVYDLPFGGRISRIPVSNISMSLKVAVSICARYQSHCQLQLGSIRRADPDQLPKKNPAHHSVTVGSIGGITTLQWPPWAWNDSERLNFG
jgi:hypothetical protein